MFSITTGENIAKDLIKGIPVIKEEWGEWLDSYDASRLCGIELKRCSVCGHDVRPDLAKLFNFCPHCGARMKHRENKFSISVEKIREFQDYLQNYFDTQQESKTQINYPNSIPEIKYDSVEMFIENEEIDNCEHCANSGSYKCVQLCDGEMFFKPI
jgi:predicted RNA-binding Zn-ribbon protein involved in translation (DUF1610 family)